MSYITCFRLKTQVHAVSGLETRQPGSRVQQGTRLSHVGQRNLGEES